ncbi:hypothetical protein [Rhizocola hellebori]|nr:hypothetical protein [Rhizocola hellebori]
MFEQTSIEPQQLLLCGCSVLSVAARPILSGNGIYHPAWRRI